MEMAQMEELMEDRQFVEDTNLQRNIFHKVDRWHKHLLLVKHSFDWIFLK